MHIYPLNGKEYHSVSLILEKTQPINLVIKWRKIKDKYEAKHGKGSWERNTEDSRTRGTSIHKLLEYLTECNPTCSKEGYKNAFDHIRNEYQDYAKQAILYHKRTFPTREIIAIEKRFVHEKLEYGGTVDLIYLDLQDNMVTLLDYKTYKGYKDEYRNRTVWQWSLMDKARVKKLEKRKTPVKDYRDWNYVNLTVKKALLQLWMYKEGIEANDLYYNGKKLTIDKIIVCVVTPYGVQEIVMPDTMKNDCRKEALDRINKFKKMVVPIDEAKAVRIAVD